MNNTKIAKMLPLDASISRVEADKTTVINMTTANQLTLVDGPENYVELKECRNGLVDNCIEKTKGNTTESTPNSVVPTLQTVNKGMLSTSPSLSFFKMLALNALIHHLLDMRL